VASRLGKTKTFFTVYPLKLPLSLYETYAAVLYSRITLF
jgi:hypothetical protein